MTLKTTNDISDNPNDYVSLVRIPRKWFNLFVWTFAILTIAHTGAELLTSWTWDALGETTLTRTSVLMTLIVGWFFIISHIVEIIMLGYAKLFKEKVLQEGIEKGREEGIEKGREEVYKALVRAHKEGKTLEEVLASHNGQQKQQSN